MAYNFSIRIDGNEIPPPSGYSIVESDLVTNSQRNAAGYASWDVTRQNVLSVDLTWECLDGDRLKRVISAIRNKKSFMAYLFNPYTGEFETHELYSGDRAAELARFISAVKYWATLSVPFVEV